MFIQKLTKDDIMLISKMILQHERSDTSHIEDYLKFSRISYCKECVSFDFCDKESEENWIHFYDYELESNFVYTKKDMDELALIYKRFMHKKFGRKYIEEMKREVADKFNKKYNSTMAELDKKIDDIVR